MVHCDLTDRDIRLNRYSRSYAARIHYYPDRVPREPRLFTARKFKAQKATWLAHDPVGVEGQSLAVMTLAIIRTATTAV